MARPCRLQVDPGRSKGAAHALGLGAGEKDPKRLELLGYLLASVLPMQGP